MQELGLLLGLVEELPTGGQEEQAAGCQDDWGMTGAQVFVFVSVRAGYQLNLAQPDCNWWPAVMESNVYLHSFQTE